ncbi:competence protein ComEA [Thermosipho melanesiensis]|uniref:Competence protein ComEA helix-hairpin-helix repeat protein n=2 Tax=Thermosipho melanesiensis TaxID=46541 RepID=A6LNS9_THEM4|nr:ComEA family DNA-binding protein [Thermosipho melanesiensis]ABR31580.1 competence protein ComEA helix-hairpin-helix repeat protein [Thermosipho melanesiensis BI429]APT74614.1 competence protein ComEA [Thermosipho melanesiensis]OOC35317.1 competence protein ComEA [Thermosipho melanesiensis]OOC35535.1 competence protein ComEA [Thermosipho melanesiensis]OOC36572.1 competence protein ComEA [Thermosipho melanesiensis]
MVKKNDIKHLVVIFIVFLVLTTAIFQQKEIIQKSGEKTRKYAEQIIDINSATFEQLVSLPGIGPTKAKSIINYREKVGEFLSIDDLLNVSGIGPSTLKKIKPFIKIKTANVITNSPSGSEDVKININNASVEELMKLPGIGKVKAQEIIEFRKKFGNVQSFEDLLKVKGIGKKTLEKIKPFIEL